MPRKKAATATRKPRSRRPAKTPMAAIEEATAPTLEAAVPVIEEAAASSPKTAKSAPAPAHKAQPKSDKFYLTREGVAFGPYTEFQVRESLRLSIFADNDLALADGAEEWVEVSRVLPDRAEVREEPILLTLPDFGTKGKRKDWREVSELLPRIEVPREPEPPVEKRPAAPLPESLLREHETLFAKAPTPSFVSELMRGKLAFAAVPVVVVVVALLTMATVFKHREPAARVAPVPHAAQQAPATQPLARNNASLTPVSLPMDRSVASRDAASAPNPGSGAAR